MKNKKVVFVLGSITGKHTSLNAYKEAEEDLTALGFVALHPGQLPKDLPDAQFARICQTMMNSSDAFLLLDGWGVDDESLMARCYRRYRTMPRARGRASLLGEALDQQVRRAWLTLELEEVFGQ